MCRHFSRKNLLDKDYLCLAVVLIRPYNHKHITRHKIHQIADSCTARCRGVRRECPSGVDAPIYLSHLDTTTRRNVCCDGLLGGHIPGASARRGAPLATYARGVSGPTAGRPALRIQILPWMSATRYSGLSCCTSVKASPVRQQKQKISRICARRVMVISLL